MKEEEIIFAIADNAAAALDCSDPWVHDTEDSARQHLAVYQRGGSLGLSKVFKITRHTSVEEA